MTLTKEQIEMYASAADATQTFEMDKGKLIAVEPKHMQELARIALASLEAEAVAYIRDGFRADGVHFCGGIITAEEHERTKPALSDRYNWKHQPLYTAPPAPVAPAGYRLQPISEYDAMCAAMLQGAAGNSPVIPDGWVMVPVEPTRDMKLQIHPIAEATCMDCGRTVTADCEDNVLLSWADMIAAAPQQEANQCLTHSTL